MKEHVNSCCRRQLLGSLLHAQVGCGVWKAGSWHSPSTSSERCRVLCSFFSNIEPSAATTYRG